MNKFKFLRKYLTSQHRLLTSSSTYSKPPPYNVLFFGTDDFALASLKKLHRKTSLVKNLEVVVLPRKGKSKCAVEMFADDNDILLHTWDKLAEFKPYDLGVVVSFGKMMPKQLIESFPLGMLNVHGSLLPNYRGAAPISRAIEAGDASTGVTVLKIAPHRYDVGNILSWSNLVAIDDETTSEQLNTTLANIGAQLLVETLSDLPSKSDNSTEQDVGSGSRASKISLNDTYIDFNSATAVEIWNKYRAFGYTKHFPLRCSLEGQMVRLTEFLKPDANDHSTWEQPGQVRYDKKSKSLVIACKRGVIRCTKLTLVRPITALDFKNGQIQIRHKRGEKTVFEALLNPRSQPKVAATPG